MKRKIDAIGEQVATLLDQTRAEAADLDYMVDKIATGIDFVSIQAQETIRRWKAGEAYRSSTLDDLKRKFRLDTFSIEDGLNLFYNYPDWIDKQRQKLAVLVRFLNPEVKPADSLLNLVEQAERLEWKKDLEMDMQVLFTLGDIKAIWQVTVDMEFKLDELEAVIKKRSQQIISPTWEPRGSL